MKAMNISSSSCASQTSTSIDLKLQSSSSMSPPSKPATAPRLLDGSGGGAGGGGRAIDRHNPIVTDGKRSLHISGSLTNTPIPSPYSPSIITTTTTTTTTNSHSPSQKTKNSTTTKKKKNHRTAPAANKLPSLTNKNELTHHRHHQYTDQTILKSAPAVKKTVSNPTTTTTEIVTNSVKGDCLVRTKRVSLVKPWLQDYITQPDTDSARYLLASDAGNDDTTVNIHHEHAAVDTDGEDHDTGAVGFFDELLRFEKHDSHSDSIIKVGAPDSDNELVAANYSPSFSPSDCGGGTTTKDDATDHSYSITTTTSVTNNSKSLTAASKSPKSLAPSSITSVSSDNNHQVVVLRVSLHCRGCEGKVRKHISRMKGVTSFNIDFAAKKVTVVGDVTPLGVLASISKVKTAQLWTPPASSMEINRRRTALV